MPQKITLMRAVSRARRTWNQHIRGITRELGIPDSYRIVIMYLFHHPGASQRDVAEFSCVTTSAVNQTVKSMLEEGYLRKEVDAADKRNSNLYLMEKGLAVAQALHKRLDASDRAITQWIGEDREAEIIALLDRVSNHIQEELL